MRRTRIKIKKNFENCVFSSFSFLFAKHKQKRGRAVMLLFSSLAPLFLHFIMFLQVYELLIRITFCISFKAFKTFFWTFFSSLLFVLFIWGLFITYVMWWNQCCQFSWISNFILKSRLLWKLKNFVRDIIDEFSPLCKHGKFLLGQDVDVIFAGN